MKITYIVGTGAVGRAFAARIQREGQPVQFVSRSAARGSLDGVPRVGVDDLREADNRILIAVPDNAVADVAQRLAALGPAPQVALHTAGCLGVEALQPLQAAGSACGVLHPLASLPDGQASALLEGAWFGLSGDEAARRWGSELIGLWQGRILALDAAGQGLYHAAAVAASNHVVALLDSAEKLMAAAGVESGWAREALIGLARGSLDQVERLGPAAALTGPVRRGDRATVSRHLEALRTHLPEEAACFSACAARTVQLASRSGLSPAETGLLESLLVTFQEEMRKS